MDEYTRITSLDRTKNSVITACSNVESILTFIEELKSRPHITNVWISLYDVVPEMIDLLERINVEWLGITIRYLKADLGISINAFYNCFINSTTISEIEFDYNFGELDCILLISPLIMKNKHIRKLNLGVNTKSERIFNVISGYFSFISTSSITHLVLQEVKFTDSSLSHLGNLTKILESLSVTRTNLTKHHLELLCNCALESTTLCKLKFSNCGLDYNNINPVINLISKSKSLRSLDLSYNPIRNEGFFDICKAMGNNKILTSFKMLSFNEVLDNSTDAISEILQNNTTLTKFTVSNCNLTSFSDVNPNFQPKVLQLSCNPTLDIKQILKLSSLTKLDLQYTSIQRTLLSFCNNLRVLNLTHSLTDFNNDDFETFCGSLVDSNVVDLNLRGNKIDCFKAAILAKYLNETKLKKLSLYLNSIKSEGLQILSNTLISNLTLAEINLDGNYFVPDDRVLILRLIKSSKHLHTIAIGTIGEFDIEFYQDLFEAIKSNPIIRDFDDFTKLRYRNYDELYYNILNELVQHRNMFYQLI